MIKRLSHVNVFVLDQERAKQFYTEKLGFEVRNDAVLDGFRWLTVGPAGQPDLAILLAYPAPPMFSPEDAETVRTLVAKGALGGGVIETDDCRATFEDLKSPRRDLPAGTGGPAVRHRGPLPRRLGQLVQPDAIEVRRRAAELTSPGTMGR